MKLLDLTLPEPEANLALDEALLLAAEEVALDSENGEVLRLWEAPRPMVVLGRSSQAAAEVNLPECARRRIPVLRRSSGGAAIVAGPGCLMYAVVLSCRRLPQLRMIDQAHHFVLSRLVKGLVRATPGVEHCGTSDLALAGRKFSGNSLRVRQTHVLYHGTLLYNFPLQLIAECLGMPPRRPIYRADRPHELFVANLSVSSQSLRAAVIDAFAANEPLRVWPEALTRQFVAEKYSQPQWNLSR